MKRKAPMYLLVVVMVISMLPTAVFAAGFSDMPEDWSKTALESAVANGLLTGANGKIMPKDNLTRAQMAVVINRAFGATQKATLDSYSDVASGAWYYDDMARAVQMGTFVGSGGKLNPDSNITREEAFAVLARAFKLSGSAESTLDKFADNSAISSWAKDSAASLISAGYVAGADGRINPKQNITRAEFAQIMYNLLKNYIKTAGIYTEVPEGNVMINVPDVTLKNVTVKGDLIIGDGVGEGEVTLDNVKVTGRTVVRGGGVNSIKIIGNSEMGSVIISKVNGNVRVVTESSAMVQVVYIDDGKDDVVVEGKIGSIEVAVSNVQVIIQKAQVENVIVEAPNVNLTIDTATTVNKVTVSQIAKGTLISGEGTVKNASLQGDNSSINTVGTKIEVGNGVTGTTSGGKPVSGGTTGTTTSNGGVTTTSTGGGSSSGGGGGSSTVAVSAITVAGAGGATTVENGGTLQMSASVAPTNATNKTVTWSVAALVNGTATIDASTGLLTATGVGTVTVTATNAASGVTGNKVITVINGNQSAPTGLAGVAPTTLGGSDGKITGTTTAMEYKLSTDTEWTEVTSTEITDLQAGTYNVRYAAKEGYNAGTAAIVEIYTDNFEPGEGDDSYQTAKLIATDGTPQSHAIFPASDEDWVKFAAQAGMMYQITTFNLLDDPNNNPDISMDTYIELYNTDGTSLIVYNDDNVDLDSNISWHCSTTGTYYVRIIHYSHSPLGNDYDGGDIGTGSYDISITAAAAATLDSIEIDNGISKNYYAAGDALELFVLGHYSDGSTLYETITAENVEGFDSSTAAADQILTVTVGGHEITYTVTIGAAAAATPISNGALNPSTVVSIIGDKFTAEATNLDNWNIYQSSYDLIVSDITLQGDAGTATGVTITFTGTATTGTIVLQPQAAALVSGVAGNEVRIVITAPSGAAITGLEVPDHVLQLGETTTATAATTEAGTIVWTSSNPAVAAIDSSTGVVTALSAGTTTISYTASTSGNANSREIAVYTAAIDDEPTIGVVQVGAANVTPTDFTTPGYGETIAWVSSDETKATVDPYTGEITAVEAGDTIIAYAVVEDLTGRVVAHGSTSIIVLAANQDQAAPTETLAGIAPTTYGGSDGKITGTTTAMEYKLSTSITWTAVTGTEITGLAAGTYNVRYAAKAGFNAGMPVNVIVAAGPVEITGYEAITNVNGGAEGAATYADAAAVIAYLNATITEVTISGTAVKVPISNWVETDTYAATEGSYTFTAAVGTLPDGYIDAVDSISAVTVNIIIGAWVPTLTGVTVTPVLVADADKAVGGTKVADLAVVGTPATGLTYTLDGTGTDDSKFQINGAALELKDGTILASQAYTVKIKAAEDSNAANTVTKEVTFTANIGPSLIPADSTSGVASQVWGALGSKQATLTITVRNAAGDNLTGLAATDFGVTVKSGGVVQSSGSFNGTPFSSFTDHGDGTYTVIYTGTSNYTYYEFVNLTANGVVIEAGPIGVITPPAERPILQSATVSADGTTITLAFDKAMCNPTTGTTDCFSAVVDGQSRTFSAAVRNADTTKIDLTLSDSPVIVQGVTVTLTYSGNYVESLDLGFLAGFSNQTVINNSTVTL